MRERRIKTTLDDYRPSDKRLFIKNLMKTDGREENVNYWQHLFEKYK